MEQTYEINKGVNRTLEFKGLKGMYIMFLLLGFLFDLFLLGVAYVLGFPLLVNIVVLFVLISVEVVIVFRLNESFGEFGLMKAMAYRQIPSNIKIGDRSLFTELIAS